LGFVYLKTIDQPDVFIRNCARAGCGPVLDLMRILGFDPNDLSLYATTFAFLWVAWLVVLCLSPLRCLPAALHFGLGMLWCLFGVCATLAI
jgi:hypothetical protein